MKNTIYYLFFLEPYTFIFFQKKEKVIYNTLNSAYICCPKHQEIDKIIRKLNDPKNGYCIRISEKVVKDPTVNFFINQVRDTFSGDLIKEKTGQKKPYIFKPMLFFNYTPEKLTKKNITIFGERILQNLNEVTFFLENRCEQRCKECERYYKQTLHCSYFHENNNLTNEDYVKIIKQLDANGVGRLNLIGGNWIKNESLITIFADSCMKKTFYQHYSMLSSFSVDLLANDSFELIVLVHPGFDKKSLLDNMLLFGTKNVVWKFIVSSSKDVFEINNLTLPEHIHIDIVPYFTRYNLDFFKENVFLELKDILELPVNKQTIFRREVLNENFFGKLFITPSGNVYANMNQAPLGNILTRPLKELVYNELYNSSAWLKVRDQEPCVHCVNKLLCPSISNYELVIDLPNLCHIR